MEDLKRILFTNGMGNDCMLIITDAKKEDIVKWCYDYNIALENGENPNFDKFKEENFVKVLVDSEMDTFSNDLVEIIGYDESYNLCDYYID